MPARSSRPERSRLPAMVLAFLLAGTAASAEVVTWTWSPGDGPLRPALRQVLRAYGFESPIPPGVTLQQWGRDHRAVVSQSGGRNRALIYQQGRGHTARLVQEGGRNRGAILQFGRGAETEMVQHGGERGVTVQIGRRPHR
ncbi:hypothetical protein [Rubellimicrobium sp. CFH 75288]|uniref:hypothetical protein n=1 Tax=Rubellimicrobium sp. CFH 75288 TaxID=2697034 RepID=UPI001412A7B5|nr:hypothetical protein [Rubellimicrobium sp. CFH 75288]NAZ37106.1 hypothetical protein [Rubellimicrobium sp. CFH 75288]